MSIGSLQVSDTSSLREDLYKLVKRYKLDEKLNLQPHVLVSNVEDYLGLLQKMMYEEESARQSKFLFEMEKTHGCS